MYKPQTPVNNYDLPTRISFIGVKGSELSTPCSQSRCDNRVTDPDDFLYLLNYARMIFNRMTMLRLIPVIFNNRSYLNSK